ncbi:MAG: hypothetical protein LBS83_02990 [Holosporales bacterium]|jgi:hypothetical protein|nr:hypothetical protein [Holosporales bacterium]
MSKKILLLGCAFAALGTVRADAAISGFYVGIQGTGSLAQLKIYDGSSHSGTTVKHNFEVNQKYAGEDLEAGEISVSVPSILTGSEEYTTTPEYQYKIKPSANIFIGYNYQIGDVVMGVELSAGTTFGAHKIDGYFKTTELNHYKLTDGDDVGGGVYRDRKVELRDDKTSDVLNGTFELKTRFSGDASVRLGYIIPGTDGRFALFLRGGVGLANQKLIYSQKGSDEFWTTAVYDAFFRPAQAKASVASLQDSDRYRYFALSDGTYFSYKLTPGLEQKLTYPGGDVPTAAMELVDDVIEMGNSGDKLLPGISGLGGDISNIEETKTRFTWHVGTDLEYHISGGAFVRVSYTFKYIKGFFAEKAYTVKTPTKEVFEKVFKAQVAEGAFDELVRESSFTGLGVGVKPTSTDLAAACDGAFDGLVGGLDLGTVNVKVGTGKKSFAHEVSLGIGFRF